MNGLENIKEVLVDEMGGEHKSKITEFKKNDPRRIRRAFCNVKP